MSTKISDLLDHDGQVPVDLNSRGRNLVNFLGKIVTSVSSSRELICSDPIQCRKYILKKRCTGSITAWCKDKISQSPIEWCCCECGEGGVIYDWQGTLFDQKELRLKRERDHICKGVWLNGQRLDEIQITLQSQSSNTGTSSLLYPSHQIVVKKCEGGVVRLTVPPFLAVELFRRQIILPTTKTVTLKLGEADPTPCRYSQVRYSHSSDEVVELDFLPDMS